MHKFETTIRVRDYETDSQGIVNNANYLHYLEIARHDFCEARGTSFAEMHRGGHDPVVRRIEIDYLTPLRMGDTMRATISVERRGPRFIFGQQIINAATGAVAVNAIVTVVVLEGGTLSRGDVVAKMLKIEE